MKKLTIFHLQHCPHCQKARMLLEKLQQENPYASVELEWVDEQKESERANRYDYYYVPCFYAGEEKLHEGKVTEEIIREVLDKVLAE